MRDPIAFVSKPNTLLINTVHPRRDAKPQLTDLQVRSNLGTPLESVLAHRGRPAGIKKHNHLKNNFMNQFIKTATLVMVSVLTLSTTYSFAATTPANEGNKKVNDGTKETKASFQKDFQNAQLISTEVRDNFTKVTFTLNAQVMTAFYAVNGDLIAVTRNIVSSQLPVSLLMSFKKNYSDYWITDLFEMSQDAQSNYYLTLENAEKKITLRSDGDGWVVYSNFKK